MGVTVAKQVQIHITNTEKLDLLRILQVSELTQLVENTHAKHLDADYLEAKEQLLEQLQEVNNAIDLVSSWRPTKPSLLDGLFDNRVEISIKDFDHLSHNQSKILSEVQELSKKATQYEQTSLRNRILEDVITKSAPLKDIELDIFGEFRYVAFIPFMISKDRSQIILQQIKSHFEDIVIEPMKKIDQEYVYVLAVRKADEKAAFDFISDKATVLTFRNHVQGSFYDLYTTSKEEFHQNEKTLNKLQSAIKSSNINLKDLYTLKDIIQSQIDIIQSLHAFTDKSKETSSLKVWIAPSEIARLKRILKRSIPNATITLVETKPEDSPVIMTNHPWVRRFETVTRIMGLPVGTSIDPTPYVAFFFTFMFALGFSEAGYALMLAALSGILLAMPRLKQGVSRVMFVIFISSLLTIIIGALFGSWFGVTPDDVDPTNALPHMKFLINIGLIGLLQRIQIMNPLDSVVSLMGFTVGLGIIHLLLGLILGFSQSVAKGEILRGVSESLSWFFFIVFGLIILAARQGWLGELMLNFAPSLSFIFLGYGVLMVFLLGREAGNIFGIMGKGLYDMFFGMIGYLSDSLSYTRLVALGLATGIIASVIGTLARLAGQGLVEQGGINLIIGYIVMIIIVIIGHTFNIALNVLGTYINVGRLHFVEFFSKFFQSGGQEFSPLKRSQEFIVIKK